MRELRKYGKDRLLRTLVLWGIVAAVILAGIAAGMAFCGRLKQFAALLYCVGAVAMALTLLLTVVRAAVDASAGGYSIDGTGVTKKGGFLIRRTRFLSASAVTGISVRAEFPAKSGLVRVKFSGGGHSLVLRDLPREEAERALGEHFGEVYAHEDV